MWLNLKILFILLKALSVLEVGGGYLFCYVIKFKAATSEKSELSTNRPNWSKIAMLVRLTTNKQKPKNNNKKNNKKFQI